MTVALGKRRRRLPPLLSSLGRRAKLAMQEEP